MGEFLFGVVIGAIAMAAWLKWREEASSAVSTQRDGGTGEEK